MLEAHGVLHRDITVPIEVPLSASEQEVRHAREAAEEKVAHLLGPTCHEAIVISYHDDTPAS
jgi:hypothetical protein